MTAWVLGGRRTLRNFSGVNLKACPPELLPIIRPIVEYLQQNDRALAFSVEQANNPKAIVPTPPTTPPQPNPTTEFLDTQFRVRDNVINSKALAFECSGIPSSTTIELIVPAISGTIALLGDLPHALLSTRHTDTTAASPQRGDIIVGDASGPAKWVRKAKGTANHFLTYDANDVVSRALVASDLPDHATRHESGGADPIQLDNLAAPSDNTDLDASTSAHGLMQKYPGGTVNFLRADGSFVAPPGGPWTTIYKSVDEDRAGTTTLTADSDLQFGMTSGNSYTIRLVVYFDTDAVPDFKYDINGPAAGIVRASRVHATAGGTPAFQAMDTSYPGSTSLLGGTNGGFVKIDISVQAPATGTFSFRWAQNTSDGASTLVLAGSYLEYIEFDIP